MRNVLITAVYVILLVVAESLLLNSMAPAADDEKNRPAVLIEAMKPEYLASEPVELKLTIKAGKNDVYLDLDEPTFSRGIAGAIGICPVGDKIKPLPHVFAMLSGSRRFTLTKIAAGEHYSGVIILQRHFQHPPLGKHELNFSVCFTSFPSKEKVTGEGSVTFRVIESSPKKLERYYDELLKKALTLDDASQKSVNWHVEALTVVDNPAIVLSLSKIAFGAQKLSQPSSLDCVRGALSRLSTNEIALGKLKECIDTHTCAESLAAALDLILFWEFSLSKEQVRRIALLKNAELDQKISEIELATQSRRRKLN